MLTVLSRPTVSVLMPAYNAERYILQSVQSVLAQTFEDFELIVVNDASSDRTLETVSSIRDRRLRVLSNDNNLGIVGSGNRALGEASGRYIARLDADDFCHPMRLARQVAFLDDSPRTLILGTEMSILRNGQITFDRQPADTDPRVLQWMLHINNPIFHPSTMFRSEVIPILGAYMREEFNYAEDFDFSHRVLRHGDISVLPDRLGIYRQHDKNVTLTHRDKMLSRVADVLEWVYSDLLGGNRAEEAMLISKHLIAAVPVGDPVVLKRIGNFLSQLIECFARVHRVSDEQQRRMRLYTGKLWWRTLQTSLAAGHVGLLARCQGFFRCDESRPSHYRLARSLASGLMPNRTLHKAARLERETARDDRSVEIKGIIFHKAEVRRYDPPSLHVVVDTEAEFDWGRGFDRSLTNVSSIKEQFRAQDIFDRYGARPIYVADYAVASQPEGYGPLREMWERRTCAIGAHMHPWINPPFEETPSDFNSFGGNLPADLEERKLRALVDVIEANFGVSPLFFKAGRYGIGPGTMDALIRLGFAVDFSLLPLTDLRARGGPDFRRVEATPYVAGDGRILSIPMSRARFGVLARLPAPLHGAIRSPLAMRMHLPGVLLRTGMVNTVTLTPEGVSADEQIQLIRSMAARGCRTFTLHYHSPSLGKHTPYVTSEAELKAFLLNLETVCRFFFETFGGLPGNPADLVPPALRGRVWPERTLVPQVA